MPSLLTDEGGTGGRACVGLGQQAAGLVARLFARIENRDPCLSGVDGVRDQGVDGRVVEVCLVFGGCDGG